MLFKMYSFQQENYKTCEETRKYDPYIKRRRRKKQTTKTARETRIQIEQKKTSN